VKSQQILLVLFLVLLVFSVFLFFKNKDSTLKNSETNFAMQETDKIDKIVITWGTTDQIILEKDRKNWKLNNIYNNLK